MFHITKRAPLFVGAIITFFLAGTIGAYEVTLKGGSEIKEGAETLKQTTEIVSQLISIQSIKLLLLILLGFFIALQGIRMLSNGLSQLITEQNAHKKGLLLGLLGITFFGCGIAVIFKDELLAHFNLKKKPHVAICNDREFETRYSVNTQQKPVDQC